jgi:large conductance mechanosensitive channel
VTLITGFKQFLLRGSIIELAVAFVIGGAFAAVVSSLVSNLITPLISMILGEPTFYGLDFTINDSIFSYGAFLDSVITFIAIAAAIYFFVVVPVDQMKARASRGEGGAEALVKTCPECLSTVPSAARRCAYCTAQIG